ncbi:hypothetical protein B296_00052457, partial [Ensete ventricosum]
LCPREALLSAGAAPAGGCRPLAGGLGRGLAVGGWPCMGADYCWSALLKNE